MTKAQILPTVLMVIQCGAALVYAFGHDWRRMGFWLAAAAMNAVVTY